MLVRNSYKKCDVLQRPKIQKSSNYQQQQPHLPFTMHKLPQDTSKRVKMVIRCNFTPKVTITYSGNPPPNSKLHRCNASTLLSSTVHREVETSRERPKSAPYLRLKIEKGDPSGSVKLQLAAKKEKN